MNGDGPVVSDRPATTTTVTLTPEIEFPNETAVPDSNLRPERRPLGDVPPLTAPDGYHYTDLGNAERLIRQHGEVLRYVPRWAKWLRYAGGRWKLDDGATSVAALAGKLGKQLVKYVPALYTSTTETRDLLTCVRRSESAGGIAATLEVARSQPGVAIDHEDLDADPWVLNVRNGTVDLRTGTLRPHNPDDLLTKQAAVEFDGEATAPRWNQFLEQVLPDAEVRRFVQRLAGLALIGEQPEHLLPILLGNGANGKTTLTSVMASVLGDYAAVASKDVLLVQRSEAHPTAKASLFGVRFAHSGELPAGRALNEAQVKELTGGDRIQARRMHENFWEFSPSHLLWLHANHRPTIKGTDDGIWRRVLLIPFDVRIPAGDQDADLARRITAQESAGVLNWALNGLADYLANGLDVPDAVRVATHGFRTDSDTVSSFIADCLELTPGASMASHELKRLHEDWFDANGVDGPVAGHYQRVTNGLKDLGATNRQTVARGRFWNGIRGLEA